MKLTPQQRVFLVNGADLGKANATIGVLQHPKTKQPANYMFCDGKVLEIQTAHQPPSSWFIDETVEADGTLYISTPIDPLFIVLSYIETNMAALGKFSPLSQLLSDTTQKDLTRLIPLVKPHIKHICEVNDKFDDMLLVKFSEAKTLAWLKKKVDQIVTHMSKDKRMCSESAAHVSTFNTATTKRTCAEALPKDTAEHTRLAIQLLSEYISKAWLESLAKEYDLTTATVLSSNKPKSNNELASEMDNEGPKTWEEKNGYGKQDIDYLQYTKGGPAGSTGQQQVKKAKKLTRGQKQLEKVDTRNMKSISSFFGKK